MLSTMGITAILMLGYTSKVMRISKALIIVTPTSFAPSNTRFYFLLFQLVERDTYRAALGESTSVVECDVVRVMIAVVVVVVMLVVMKVVVLVVVVKMDFDG